MKRSNENQMARGKRGTRQRISYKEDKESNVKLGNRMPKIEGKRYWRTTKGLVPDYSDPKTLEVGCMFWEIQDCS